MLSQSPLTLIPVALIILVTAYNWLRKWRANRAFAASRGCKPPPRLSRFRNLRAQVKSITSHSWLDMYWQWYSNIGHTFESASISIDPIIFTCDPENIKTILATDFKKFDLGPRRRAIMGPYMGPGIFSNDGAAWKHSRNMLRPNFSKTHFSELSIFESHFQELLTALPQADPQSGLVEVDLQPLFFRMQLDSASELLLGRGMSFHSQTDPEGSASLRFMEAFDYAQNKILRRSALDRGWTKPFALMYFLWKGKNKDKFEQACETVHSIMDDMVAEFLRNLEKRELKGENENEENKRYVFLEEMAKTTRDPLELRYEILNIMFAGRDTTSSLLGNTFFMLARHPEIYTRVRAEVVDTFHGELPDYTTLRNMKQVKNLLSEVLRLYPPLPFNSRVATANTTLPRGGGPDGDAPIFLKQGTQVDFHVWALHRSSETFGPDAQEFRPDRWEDPNLRPGWGYIPFNGGPRVCLGQQLALTEASYVLVRVMQLFADIENRDVEPQWTEQVALVTKNRLGTKVALKPAEKA